MPPSTPPRSLPFSNDAGHWYAHTRRRNKRGRTPQQAEKQVSVVSREKSAKTRVNKPGSRAYIVAAMHTHPGAAGHKNSETTRRAHSSQCFLAFSTGKATNGVHKYTPRGGATNTNTQRAPREKESQRHKVRADEGMNSETCPSKGPDDARTARQDAVLPRPNKLNADTAEQTKRVTVTHH